MKISIRTKLIIAITLLLVVLFSAAAVLFVKEKRVELAQDIYKNMLDYTSFTAANISYFHDVYLDRGGFLAFHKEIQSLMDQNEYIGGIKITSFEGALLYNSSVEREAQYEGEPRTVTDETLLQQIRSEHISALTADGNLFFIKEDGSFVDGAEKPISAMEEGTLLKHMAVPATEKHTVFYELDYTKLYERIARVRERIAYLALFGIILGFAMAIFISRQILRPVEALVKSASQISTGDFTVRVDIRTRDEMEFLGDAFNHMARDLGASVEARVYRERTGRELELAAEIQKQFLPKQTPKIAGIDVAAGIIPASEIGGDLYDFLPIAEKKLITYLGDVTGHGVPAGIVSAMANALLFGFRGKDEHSAVLAQINSVLRAKCLSNVFMTLCLMDWDGVSGAFRFVSAGHEPLLYYRSASKSAEFLAHGGIALGMTDNIKHMLTVREIKPAPGDFVIAYSDGITEMWKNEKEQYGKKRFLAAVEKFNPSWDAGRIRDAIFDDVKNFAAGYKQKDDMTVLVIKFT